MKITLKKFRELITEARRQLTNEEYVDRLLSMDPWWWPQSIKARMLKSRNQEKDFEALLDLMLKKKSGIAYKPMKYRYQMPDHSNFSTYFVIPLVNALWAVGGTISMRAFNLIIEEFKSWRTIDAAAKACLMAADPVTALKIAHSDICRFVTEESQLTHAIMNEVISNRALIWETDLMRYILGHPSSAGVPTWPWGQGERYSHGVGKKFAGALKENPALKNEVSSYLISIGSNEDHH